MNKLTHENMKKYKKMYKRKLCSLSKAKDSFCNECGTGRN